MIERDRDDVMIDRWLRDDPEKVAAAHGPAGIHRRHFLQGALALGAASMIDMRWLTERAGAAPLAADDRIFVAIELTGGNDGLDTLIPTGTGRYHDLRKGLARKPGAGRPIAPGWELHPAMKFVSEQYAAGNVAFVEGVGDSAGNRSHFVTMARVMSGEQTLPAAPTGWLGRYLDAVPGTVLSGINVDNGGIPLHMKGRSPRVTGLTFDKRMFGASTANAPMAALNDAVLSQAQGPRTGSAMDMARTVFGDSVAAARQIEPVYDVGETNSPMAHRMTLLANAINLDVGGRVLTTRLNGFDAHQSLIADHDRLMGELDAGLAAFFGKLDQRFADRVCVLVFSEFGRRVSANTSAGVDHGAGSTWFLVGNRVRGGRYGTPADLGRLDRQGDVKIDLDIRSVYASVLSTWLGADDREILGSSWDKLDLFADAAAPAPSRPPSSGGSTLTPEGNYIDALHLLFLHRSASADDVAKWTPAVKRGDRMAVTNALAVSDEWAGARVNELYRTVLGRDADARGRAHWVGVIAKGVQLEKVAADFYGSPEYFQRNGGTNEKFVDSLYRNILGRASDRSGRNHWTSVVGTIGRTAVAASFYASIESRRSRVNALYQEILGRKPDAGGHRYWADALLRTGDVTLAAQLASSEEFYRRSQR